MQIPWPNVNNTQSGGANCKYIEWQLVRFTTLFIMEAQVFEVAHVEVIYMQNRMSYEFMHRYDRLIHIRCLLYPQCTWRRKWTGRIQWWP